MTGIDSYIGAIAHRILGQPTSKTRSQQRYGTHGSVAVEIAGAKAGSWFDHENNVGGGAWQLIRDKAGVADKDIPGWLKREFGIDLDQQSGFNIVQTYDYQDEAGKLLFQVCRLYPKDFRQRRPDGVGGWKWSVKGVRIVPYRLPELAAARSTGNGKPWRCYICEGEKDADRLRQWGLTASCNPGGAGKWRNDFDQYFTGAEVIVIPDNDDAGREHAKKVAAALAPVAVTIKVIELACLPEKGDVSDWIAAGGSQSDLETLVENTESYRPPSVTNNIPDCCDEALALAFSQQHEPDLRYLAATGHWLLWDNTRWHVENTLKVFDLSRKLCREQSAAVMRWTEPNIKLAAIVASAKTVAAVERLARADRRHATEADAWNQQHDALNTENGTIELETSKSRPSNRADLCTKIAASSIAACEIKLWTKFLDTITAGNQDLQAYLQRMAGYCATGLTIEQVLFFLYGTGANGKGVFIKTIADVLNDYAAVASMDLFLESRQEHHPTDLAHLWGARLVYCQEIERNRGWAESKIKAMTGGDKLTARFMRQDFFDFVPRFKIVIAGNHKPSLHSVDEAIRRRLQLVPFTVTIPRKDRDLRLAETLLKDERPGILKWIIDGAKDWYAKGLQPPAVVTDASEAYFAEQDRFSKWLDERCIVHKARSAFTNNLFANWKQWNDETDDHPGSMKAFSQKLDDLGFRREREPGTGNRMFCGLSLTDEAAGFTHPVTDVTD